MKTQTAVLLSGAGAGLLALGVLIGVWFTLNFDIVRKEVGPRTQSPLADAPDREPKKPGTHLFTAGEEVRYRLTADVLGSGIEQANDPMDIDLDFGADMSLVTKSVNSQGEGELELRFEQALMTGRFMGSPVRYAKKPDGAQFNMPGSPRADSGRGQGLRGIPQMEFFDTPISMRVGPDGRVSNVKGVQGFERILAVVPVMASDRMPEIEVPPDTEWEYAFPLPIPGIPKPPTAYGTSRFVGYQVVQDRRCAVVRQMLRSEEIEGSVQSPESGLGEAIGFSMPKFILTGNNTLYYDVDTGRLVRSDIDVHFGLELGQELQGAAQLLGIYGSLLGDLEGGGDESELQIDNSMNMMELGVDIKGNLVLMP